MVLCVVDPATALLLYGSWHPRDHELDKRRKLDECFWTFCLFWTVKVTNSVPRYI